MGINCKICSAWADDARRRTTRGDAGEKQLVMVRESAIEQRPTLWSAKIVLHREGKGEAAVCPCF